MVTGGKGIKVTNLPGGIGISLDQGTIRKMLPFDLAEIVTAGPNGESDLIAPPSELPGYFYWVRQIVMRGVELAEYFATTTGAWRLPKWFEFKKDGFWEPAINLAEVGLPSKCRHLLMSPYERAIPVDPETDDTPEGNVTDPEDEDYKSGTIVATWPCKEWFLPRGERVGIRAFSLFPARITEEYVVQTYDLDGDGCPDPYAWIRRAVLRLWEGDETP